MNKLYLLRHAKAGWALPGVRDFDRPLNSTGVADAKATGIAMRANGYVPKLTLCSNARRARDTLEGLAAHADTGRIIFTDDLYSADANGYLNKIRENGQYGSVLIIGHNPMLEDLAMAVSGYGEDSALYTLQTGFPTSGLAAVRFEGELSTAELGKGFLEAFLTPVNL